MFKILPGCITLWILLSMITLLTSLVSLLGCANFEILLWSQYVLIYNIGVSAYDHSTSWYTFVLGCVAFRFLITMITLLTILVHVPSRDRLCLLFALITVCCIKRYIPPCIGCVAFCLLLTMHDRTINNIGFPLIMYFPSPVNYDHTINNIGVPSCMAARAYFLLHESCQLSCHCMFLLGCAYTFYFLITMITLLTTLVFLFRCVTFRFLLTILTLVY